MNMVMGIYPAAGGNIAPGAEFNGAGTVQQGKAADQDIGFPFRVGKDIGMENTPTLMNMAVRVAHRLIQDVIELFPG